MPTTGTFAQRVEQLQTQSNDADIRRVLLIELAKKGNETMTPEEAANAILAELFQQQWFTETDQTRQKKLKDKIEAQADLLAEKPALKWQVKIDTAINTLNDLIKKYDADITTETDNKNAAAPSAHAQIDQTIKHLTAAKAAAEKELDALTTPKKNLDAAIEKIKSNPNPTSPMLAVDQEALAQAEEAAENALGAYQKMRSKNTAYFAKATLAPTETLEAVRDAHKGTEYETVLTTLLTNTKNLNQLIANLKELEVKMTTSPDAAKAYDEVYKSALIKAHETCATLCTLTNDAQSLIHKAFGDTKQQELYDFAKRLAEMNRATQGAVASAKLTAISTQKVRFIAELGGANQLNISVSNEDLDKTFHNITIRYYDQTEKKITTKAVPELEGMKFSELEAARVAWNEKHKDDPSKQIPRPSQNFFSNGHTFDCKNDSNRAEFITFSAELKAKKTAVTTVVEEPIPAVANGAAYDSSGAPGTPEKEAATTTPT